MIIDDVITAGTAIRESIDLIESLGARAARGDDRAGSPGKRPGASCRRSRNSNSAASR